MCIVELDLVYYISISEPNCYKPVTELDIFYIYL